jgi:hypothetical protein
LTGLDREVAVWLYISDEVAPTVDECFPPYGQGGYLYSFSQMTGLIRLDGMFGDWDAASGFCFKPTIRMTGIRRPEARRRGCWAHTPT